MCKHLNVSLFFLWRGVWKVVQLFFYFFCCLPFTRILLSGSAKYLNEPPLLHPPFFWFVPAQLGVDVSAHHTSRVKKKKKNRSSPERSACVCVWEHAGLCARRRGRTAGTSDCELLRAPSSVHRSNILCDNFIVTFYLISIYVNKGYMIFQRSFFPALITHRI